jgi:hypothetical protein
MQCKTRWNRWLYTTLILAGVSNLGAQAPAPPHGGPGGFRHGGDMDFMAREMGSKTVTGAPFTATATTQTTQVLPNGTHINRTSTGAVYRDSQGRTRREETVGPVGALASSGSTARQMVFIHDPVASAAYVLNPQNKTARKMAFARRGPNSQTGTAATGAGQTGQEATESISGAAPNRQHAPFGGSVKTESLGTQVIAGVTAEGTRHTLTIPAGAMGNDQAIQSVSERWYSSDLQIVVKSVHTDPRFGQTTYQLTNVSRAEPPATLFEVPADYTAATGGHRGKTTPTPTQTQ